MGKLTIQEIAKILVEKNGLEQREANQFAVAMFDIIHRRLEAGEQVKVKGFGTFKIINVDARESVSVRTGERVVIGSHSKVTFTPDATMKELVNKPFSQFETVPLNDGVEFEDLKDDLTDEELEAVESMEEETIPAPVVEEPVVEEPVVEEPVVEESIIEEPVVEASVNAPVFETPHIEEPAPVVEEVVPEVKVPKVEVPEEVPVEEEPEVPATEEFVFDDEEESRPWGKWLLCALCVLALMAASAYGGYYYANMQPPAIVVPDTVIVKDTVYVAEQQDSIVQPELVEEQPETTAQPAAEPVKPAPVQEQSKAQPAPAKEQPAAEPVDKYAQKDERVRLGAYRIVGLSHEVKVLEGQTFYSICRAHLGPDMECYVEVYNDLPRSPKVKAGQIIKIPKLQLKKRKK